MAIISLGDWQKVTSGSWYNLWRHDRLKAVDAALQAYWADRENKATHRALLTAVEAYLRDPACRDSVSDRNGGDWIFRLLAGARELVNPRSDPYWEMARQLMKESRRQSLVRLFHGRQVIWKKNEKLKMLAEIGLRGKAFYDAAKYEVAHKTATALLTDVIKKAVHNEAIAHAVAGFLLPQVLDHFVTALLPYVGTAASAAKAASNGFTAVTSLLQKKAVATVHRPYVARGHAVEALEALCALLQAQAVDAGKRAGIYASSALIKGICEGVGVGVAGGIAAGVAEVLAITVLDVWNAAQEYRMIGATNRILCLPAAKLMNASALFSEFPLTGAYFVIHAHNNELIGSLGDDVGTADWREVTAMIAERHIRPLREYATDFAAKSRLTFSGLSVHGKGYLAKCKGMMEVGLGMVSSAVGLDGVEQSGKAAWVTTRQEQATTRARHLRELGDAHRFYTEDDKAVINGRLAPAHKPAEPSRAETMARLLAPIVPGRAIMRDSDGVRQSHSEKAAERRWKAQMADEF